MSKKEEAEYEEYESLKNSKFKQQKLPGWRPVPSMARATTIFFSLGIVFAGLGVLILLFSYDTYEHQERYDDKCNLNTNCTINFTIKRKMNKNIMVYYRLDNFYQNHRRYIQSKTEDLNNKTISLGLMGKNYFNDTFFGWKIKGSSDNLKFNDLNIARKSDIEKYKDFTVSDYKDIELDEHFLVWMRPAPLTNFLKLYGRIEEDIEPNSNIEVTINNIYNSSHFNGSKYIILRTVNNFGGDNTFLAIGYMIFGGVCLILGIAFSIGYKIKAKKEK